MSVGLYVWIGIDPSKHVWEDGHADERTVAPTQEVCQDRIDVIGDDTGLVPTQRLLILKGRISDR